MGATDAAGEPQRLAGESPRPSSEKELSGRRRVRRERQGRDRRRIGDRDAVAAWQEPERTLRLGGHHG